MFSSITSGFVRALFAAFIKIALTVMILCIAAGLCFTVMELATASNIKDAMLSVGDLQDIVIDGTEVLNDSNVEQYLSYIVILKPIAEHLFRLHEGTFDINQLLSMEFYADLALIELAGALVLVPILRFTSYLNERIKNKARLQQVPIMLLFDFILYLLVILVGAVCTGMLFRTLTILTASFPPLLQIVLAFVGILILSFLNALFHKKFLTFKRTKYVLKTLFVRFALDVLIDFLYSIAVAFTVCVVYLIIEYSDAMLAAGDMTVYALFAALIGCVFLIPFSCFLVFRKKNII